MTEKTYVLYHDDSDGFASAAVAHLVLKDAAEYIVVQYGQPFPDVPLDKDTLIYIVDFSYDASILDKVNEQVKFLKVIDHHESALEQLKDKPYGYFDMNHSGAALAWKYFCADEMPYLIQLVEDRDLWRFNLSESRAFEAGIKFTGKSKNLAYWCRLLEDNIYINSTMSYELSEIIKSGRVLVQAQESKLKSFVSRMDKYRIVDLFGLRVAIYNAVDDISELGEAFYTNEDLDIAYTISYFFTNKGVVVLSFRAHKESDINVKEVAKIFGGGGHKPSSGAPLSLKDGLAFLEAIYSLPEE